MAYTSIHTIRATVSAAIAYITNGDKTVNGVYVSSYACRADSAGASEDFRAVRNTGTGRTEILAYHMIQSFAPNEVTPEQAMQIGEELCDRYLKGDYQYVLAVHTDKQHTHIHVVFNNTNLYNGLSFTTEHNQGRKSERAWAELREISDEICAEHGLSLIDPKGKGVSHFERDMQKEGKSWKEKLRQLLDEIISYSKNFEDFLKNCTDSGIEYVYTPRNKVKLKFRLKDEGQQRFTRADTLGENYTPERIAEQIQKALEKTVAPKSEYVYKPPTDEELFKAFGVHLDEVDEPESTENQPYEKKNDMWEEIRDMRNSDTIIANLESGGIISLDDLRSFFWNCRHPDDYTDELTKLNKKIKAIDKLIKMLKQRSKHSATYKEYQERSAFTQKSFRKKNAVEIDSYEQADKYIREHIKAYYVDGKAPKRSDLEQQVIELKSEYNALLPEHNAFVKRQKAASQYAKQVRQYLDAKRQQERNRQYQERKRNQQRKNTLE